MEGVSFPVIARIGNIYQCNCAAWFVTAMKEAPNA